MKVEQDARFREQREQYSLRWNCEDCALFDAELGCAHGYPTHRHRRSRYDDPRADLLFCKDFELA
ncbi:MAG: hypothetical protein AAGF92_24010 [Myxococcota bacterium]